MLLIKETIYRLLGFGKETATNDGSSGWVWRRYDFGVRGWETRSMTEAEANDVDWLWSIR